MQHCNLSWKYLIVLLLRIGIGIPIIWVIYLGKTSYDFKELWQSNFNDADLVTESNRLECYCPITEDISLDDVVLCDAVEKIEEE